MDGYVATAAAMLAVHLALALSLFGLLVGCRCLDFHRGKSLLLALKFALPLVGFYACLAARANDGCLFAL